MAAVAVIVVLLLAVAAVAWPIVYGSGAKAEERDAERIADLLARRDSLYRQIRELELDHRTGKLEAGEYREQDRRLRATAIDVLHELDLLGAGEPPKPGDEPAPPEGDAPGREPATLRSP